MTDPYAEAIDLVQEQAWTPAYDSGSQVRVGVWITEITGGVGVTRAEQHCDGFTSAVLTVVDKCARVCDVVKAALALTRIEHPGHY